MPDIAEVKVTPDEEKIREIVEKAIKDKLKEQFNLGMMAGWDACSKKRERDYLLWVSLYGKLGENSAYGCPV